MILYLFTLLKLAMSCKSFSVEFVGSLTHIFIPTANNSDIFLICISFSYLIALVKTSTILNRDEEIEQPCLFPELNDAFYFCSFLSIDTDFGLDVICFIMLRYLPCIPYTFGTFIMKGYWNLSKSFSISNEMIIIFFCFSFYKMDYIYYFIYFELSLHILDEAHAIIVDYFWMSYRTSFASNLLKNFYLLS